MAKVEDIARVAAVRCNLATSSTDFWTET